MLHFQKRALSIFPLSTTIPAIQHISHNVRPLPHVNIYICMFIQQLEKVRVAYHKSCQREQAAAEKEKQANENTEMSPEKKQKYTEAREKAKEEKEKVRRDVHALHHLTPC